MPKHCSGQDLKQHNEYDVYLVSHPFLILDKFLELKYKLK